jgi:hydrogenase maturation protease
MNFAPGRDPARQSDDASSHSKNLHPYGSFMRTRVIGLGNTILKDDGAGIYAAREVRRRLSDTPPALCPDIAESEVAGFALMELMAGWERIILLDSIQFDGQAPGAVVRLEPADLHTSLRLRSVHEIDLPTVMELGRRLGLPMPRQVIIFGIQAEDACTFGESVSGSVEGGIDKVVQLVLDELKPQAC